MDNFQISDKPSGPWLQLSDYKSAQQALDSARGNFDWPVVWVAQMRRIDAGDLLPPAEQFIGEVMERVATVHGGTVADLVAQRLQESEHVFSAAVWNAVDGCMLGSPTDPIIWVPDTKRMYSRDRNVRPADFIMPSDEAQLVLPTLEEANADLDSRKVPLKDLLS